MEKLIAEKRRCTRLTISIPVSYEILGDRKIFGSCLAKDIDNNGLKIRIDKFFPANTKLAIKLYFPEVKKIAQGEARITWAQPINYSNKYHLGVEFINFNPIYKKWIEEYIMIHKTFRK
ncbi:MAG: PilZ domain-containing protein [Candidatus Omnitrophota bacterium]